MQCSASQTSYAWLWRDGWQRERQQPLQGALQDQMHATNEPTTPQAHQACVGLLLLLLLVRLAKRQGLLLCIRAPPETARHIDWG